ncbi:MAG: hypothetical protein J1G38_00230 [Clostridiales bacterium]|nr:hypothetical protein [Clostridiales bacterium]
MVGKTEKGHGASDIGVSNASAKKSGAVIPSAIIPNIVDGSGAPRRTL